MPVFPMFDGKGSILLESLEFSNGSSYPFSAKYMGNRSAENVSLWLGTDLCGDPFMTLVSKRTLEGLHLQSLLNVTARLYLSASV